MKVLKFGGTSVGKPERMQAVAELVTNQHDTCVVVLSALSGTTNSLVEIGKSLATGHRDLAALQIKDLHKHYEEFCNQLITAADARKKAETVLAEHFEFLEIILKISYSEALQKDILAQGELLSTRLFTIYLE